MALDVSDFRPGCVAYFDAQSVNADPLVAKTGDPVTRIGTMNGFVCYKIEGPASWWAPLTSTARTERVRIDPSWLSCHRGKLGDGGVYLQDGKNTYAGPTQSFIAASKNEVLIGPRAYLSADGVAAIVAEVKNRGGAL